MALGKSTAMEAPEAGADDPTAPYRPQCCPAPRPPPRAKHTAIFTRSRVLRDIGLVVRGSSARRMPKGRPRVAGTADRIVGPLRRRPPPGADAVSWSCSRSPGLLARARAMGGCGALVALDEPQQIEMGRTCALSISVSQQQHAQDDMTRHAAARFWGQDPPLVSLLGAHGPSFMMRIAPTSDPHRSPWCLAARPPARTKQTAISAGVCGAETRGGARGRASFCSLLIMSDSRMKAMDECGPAIAGEQNAAWRGKGNWAF
ncbi:hypothetical protein BJ912DRAFT_1067490 [Pholiota molesta]|nr:hypothetical protein BJ912DRAFT_1067490 [Pholiota molesta]